MQGQDKGLILLAHLPMIQHVINRLLPQTERICITANRNLDAYHQYGWPVISDTLDNYPGPLAGFLTAFTKINSEWILNVPCDAPFLPDNLIMQLSSAIRTTNKKVAVAHTHDGLQPTFCLLHHSLKDDLHTYLEQGKRKTGQWLLNNEPALAEYEDECHGFANINTFEELNDVQKEFT